MTARSRSKENDSRGATGRTQPGGPDRPIEEKVAGFVEQVRTGDVEPQTRLGGYLEAPEGVREAFDKRALAFARNQADWDRYWHERIELDDPLAREPEKRLRAPQWSGAWERRASRPPPRLGEPYSRDTDPLLEMDLRELWPLVTGEEVPASGFVSCPAPEHEDLHPSCSVRESAFNCFSCGVGGSAIDLGAQAYGIEPRGRGFHALRRELLAAAGIEEARAEPDERASRGAHDRAAKARGQAQAARKAIDELPPGPERAMQEQRLEQAERNAVREQARAGELASMGRPAPVDWEGPGNREGIDLVRDRRAIGVEAPDRAIEESAMARGLEIEL